MAKVKAKSKGKSNARRRNPAKVRAKKKPPQTFAFSHHRDEDFDSGLRPYSAYRDLGFAKATNGQLQAHVIRMTKPFNAEDVAIPHYHDVDFQMVYVLRGWFRTSFEGHGPETFHAGSSWIQPPRIKHTVVGYSDDCELLEIVLPAEFETVTLEKPKAKKAA
ncbi:MAG: cupin domain-containing protein [Pseudolabrys sp.]|nr:cupin domain-containing protein [Pseudolabrys sp.]MBV9259894.1 cupin domain-containing protein [Pseudolabrys sp.]